MQKYVNFYTRKYALIIKELLKKVKEKKMDEKKELKLLLSKMEYHIEEEIEFVNEICSDNFTSYDTETIVFYLSLRELFKQYKKKLRELSKEIEKRKDTL